MEVLNGEVLIRVFLRHWLWVQDVWVLVSMAALSLNSSLRALGVRERLLAAAVVSMGGRLAPNSSVLIGQTT